MKRTLVMNDPKYFHYFATKWGNNCPLTNCSGFCTVTRRVGSNKAFELLCKLLQLPIFATTIVAMRDTIYEDFGLNMPHKGSICLSNIGKFSEGISAEVRFLS